LRRVFRGSLPKRFSRRRRSIYCLPFASPSARPSARAPFHQSSRVSSSMGISSNSAVSGIVSPGRSRWSSWRSQVVKSRRRLSSSPGGRRLVSSAVRPEGIGSGLELDQQVDVEPARPGSAPADTPDHVAMAFAQVFADEAAADPFQGGEIEGLHPALAQEAAEQLHDHLWVGEEKLVAAVVIRHRTSVGRQDAGFQEVGRKTVWRSLRASWGSRPALSAALAISAASASPR
jgi:hypothetical protein